MKKHSLDKITFSLLIERVLTKVDNLLSTIRDECYTSAVANVQSLVQKEFSATSKIEQELARQKSQVHHLTTSRLSFLMNFTEKKSIIYFVFSLISQR